MNNEFKLSTKQTAEILGIDENVVCALATGHVQDLSFDEGIQLIKQCQLYNSFNRSFYENLEEKVFQGLLNHTQSFTDLQKLFGETDFGSARRWRVLYRASELMGMSSDSTESLKEIIWVYHQLYWITKREHGITIEKIPLVHKTTDMACKLIINYDLAFYTFKHAGKESELEETAFHKACEYATSSRQIMELRSSLKDSQKDRWDEKTFNLVVAYLTHDDLEWFLRIFGDRVNRNDLLNKFYDNTKTIDQAKKLYYLYPERWLELLQIVWQSSQDLETADWVYTRTSFHRANDTLQTAKDALSKIESYLDNQSISIDKLYRLAQKFSPDHKSKKIFEQLIQRLNELLVSDPTLYAEQYKVMLPMRENNSWYKKGKSWRKERKTHTYSFDSHHRSKIQYQLFQELLKNTQFEK